MFSTDGALCSAGWRHARREAAQVRAQMQTCQRIFPGGCCDAICQRNIDDHNRSLARNQALHEARPAEFTSYLIEDCGSAPLDEEPQLGKRIGTSAGYFQPIFVAGGAFLRMRLFPRADGLRLVVIHFFVHAHAVFADHRGRSATLVVVNALVDPFEVVVVHLLGQGARTEQGSGDAECGDEWSYVGQTPIQMLRMHSRNGHRQFVTSRSWQ